MTSWPYTNQPIDLSQYTRLFGRMQDSGVAGPLGSSTALVASADGSGMTVSVAAGFAVIRGHAYYTLAPQSLPVGASSGSQRIDSIVLRLDPSKPDATKVVVAVLPGSATPPTLTQTEVGIYEIELARVTVPAGAVVIQAANVTDVRQYIGSNVRAWTTATRPPGALGILGWNETLKLWEGWNGTAFVPLDQTVTWNAVTGKPSTFPPIIGSGATQAKAGDWVPSWNEVTGKPTTFAPIVGFGPTQAKPGDWNQPWNQISGVPSVFNPANHDINSGVHTGLLSIANGGTGANSASAALQALGIFVQSTQPAYAAGRVWIKIP